MDDWIDTLRLLRRRPPIQLVCNCKAHHVIGDARSYATSGCWKGLGSAPRMLSGA